jgi:GT2 family glycosyltransferase
VAEASAQPPRFSVVVPTYGRARQLGECLAALAALDYPRDRLEVLVADDGSPEPPREAVARLADRLDVRLLEAPHHGPAAARNRGAAAARGELLAFTDDDCRPTPGWLRALAARLRAEPRAAVGGLVRNGLAGNRFSAGSQLLVDFLYQRWNERPGGAVLFTSNNLALSADLFRELGGFDASFPLPAAEDRDLCDRWRARGLPLRYATEAVVDHYHELDARRFWHQHFRYGVGARHLHRLRAARGADAAGVEGLGFYLGMLAFPFSRAPVFEAATLSALFVLAQVANVAGYLSAARRRRGPPVPP